MERTVVGTGWVGEGVTVIGRRGKRKEREEERKGRQVNNVDDNLKF